MYVFPWTPPFLIMTLWDSKVRSPGRQLGEATSAERREDYGWDHVESREISTSHANDGSASGLRRRACKTCR